MKKLTIIALICICLISNTLPSYANGGPEDTAAVIEGGNIEFYDITTIRIISENLNIKLEENRVKVRAEYVLENQSDSLSTSYAFPVDIIESEFTARSDNDYEKISDFRMIDNGNLLEYQITEGEFGEFEGDDYERSRVDYYTSNLFFDEGELKTLVVEYDVVPGYMDWGTSKWPFPSFGNKTFRYDLSPASHWGDGTIGSFLLEIDTRDIDIVDGSVIDVSFPVEEKNGLLVYKEEDFVILDNSKLEITYEYEGKLFNDFLELHNGKNQIKAVTSSSSLEGCTVRNLFDNDNRTCWAEDSNGLGIGDWIRIDLIKPTSVMWLYISNGYYKNVDTFNYNGRIKEALLYVYSDNPVNGETVVIEELRFDEREYGLEFWEVNTTAMHDYYQDVTSIMLVIKDVYEGEKYDDTCISEVLLLSHDILNNNETAISYQDNLGDLHVFEDAEAINDENSSAEDEDTSTEDENNNIKVKNEDYRPVPDSDEEVSVINNIESLEVIDAIDQDIDDTIEISNKADQRVLIKFIFYIIIIGVVLLILFWIRKLRSEK